MRAHVGRRDTQVREVAVEHPDQVVELHDPVLHRGPGHQEGALAALRPPATAWGRLAGLRVLHGVRLVHHQQCDLPAGRGGKAARRVEGGPPGPAPPLPAAKARCRSGPCSTVTRRALRASTSRVQFTKTLAGQTTMKWFSPAAAKLCRHGDRLDGLAESHLVAEQHLALREREPRAERLVAAQGAGGNQRPDSGEIQVGAASGPVADLGLQDGGKGRHPLAISWPGSRRVATVEP